MIIFAMIAAVLSQTLRPRNFASAWTAGASKNLGGSLTRQFRPSVWTLRESFVDEYGRRLRQKSDAKDDWNVVPPGDDSSRQQNNKAGSGDSWDDFDPFNAQSTSPQRSPQRQRDERTVDRTYPSRGSGRSGGREQMQEREGRTGDRKYPNSREQMREREGRTGERKYPARGPGQQGRSVERERPKRGPGLSEGREQRYGDRSRGRERYGGDSASKEAPERRINMNALENAGFVHLYGLSSTLNALKANKRDFSRPEDRVDIDSLEGEDLLHEQMQRDRKPEAQFSPWLFLQDQKGEAKRAAAKAFQADQVKRLAEERGIPIAYVDKGVLNTLSQNRPHQGYVLRCGKLDFESLTTLPSRSDESRPSLWLTLDEVVDPQNLGALLRSAYFLGGDKNVQVLVCAKNSAPPSPVVSASSAGALELMDIFSTSNLPRTLAAAEQDGYRVIGASSSVPSDVDDNVKLYNLQDLPPLDPDQPTVLVLGSEGHGLRSLVAASCTEFVRIPSGPDSAESEDKDGGEGVDSLNVSVTGGILLWHLLRDSF